jgi:phage-related protein
MIFAEIQYQSQYENFHAELKAFLEKHFLHVESGLQGDSWFWIFDNGEKVAIDTFTSMKHQVKSPKVGEHVQKVIEALRLKYKVNVYDQPKLEGHEEI